MERHQEVGVERGRMADAERVVLTGADGEVSFVVLAVLDNEGSDFALVCREDDLGDDAGAYVFAYGTDSNGAAVLSVVEDDDRYDEMVHLFADLIDDEEPA